MLEGDVDELGRALHFLFRESRDPDQDLVNAVAIFRFDKADFHAVRREPRDMADIISSSRNPPNSIPAAASAFLNPDCGPMSGSG